MIPRMKSTPIRFCLFLLFLALPLCVVTGQDDAEPPVPPDTTVPVVPQQVTIEPVAEDEGIANRLSRILKATRWFEQIEVRVDEGVVFISGVTYREEHRQWASQLVGKTEGVVAVVNRISVTPRSIWDMTPVWADLKGLIHELINSLPLILLGIVLLIVTWFASKLAVHSSDRLLGKRMKSHLLRQVISRAVAIPVFLVGLYLVLRISGLTGLAATVIGGTGLIGLVIGFAFRDIAENFLASILLSMQRPFVSNDLIEVAGFKGYVQSVNTRSTVLMTLEGNHLQIPNATMYKETIINYTANPNARFDFLVGIGYDDSITQAQSIALAAVINHSAVIADPEPLVLVENLGPATVNLHVYFWVNIGTFSGLKVKSAVIRQVKRAFDDAGISMPDEAREVVFPAGVPVHMVEKKDDVKPAAPSRKHRLEDQKQEPEVHSAEGDLSSETEEIEMQAKHSRSPEAGENLLATNADKS